MAHAIKPSALAASDSPLKFSLFFESKLVRLFTVALDTLYQSWFQIEYEGLENLPQDRPFLLAANHSSHLDAGAVMTALRSQVSMVFVLGARDYFCDTPMQEWFFRTFFNLIPCDRHRNLLSVLKKCRAELDRDKPILIFPEGTRSLTGELQPFQAGIGYLALQLKVSILPVLIEGTFEALPKGRLIPRRHKLRVLFGSGVDPLQYQNVLENRSTRDLCLAITAEIEQKIQRLRDR